VEKKGLQVIKDVASKTAGLVFFSLLAIALGVVFGVMFERWVGVNGETGTPAASSSVEAPVDEVATQPVEANQSLTTPSNTTQAPAAATTKYKVKVGPYTDYATASKAAEELGAQGYPVLLPASAPYLIQVGAFSKKENALALKTELTEKGYAAAMQPE
jgi:cell division septation protein DedD